VRAVRIQIEQEFGCVLADAQVADGLTVLGVEVLPDGRISDVVLVVVLIKAFWNHTCVRGEAAAAGASVSIRVGAVTGAEFLLDCFLPLLPALPFKSFESLHDLRVRFCVVSVPSSDGGKGYEQNKEESVMGWSGKQRRKAVGRKVWITAEDSQSNQPVPLAVPPEAHVLHHLIRSDVSVRVPAGGVGCWRATATTAALAAAACAHLAPLALGLSVHSCVLCVMAPQLAQAPFLNLVEAGPSVAPLLYLRNRGF
jgi:hypothetical protein